MRRHLKRLAWALGVIVVVLVGWIAWTARMETTAAGVPVRWLLPVSAKGSIAIPVMAATQRRIVIPGFLDGPVVKRDAGGWRARWYCEDRVHVVNGSGPTLRIACAGRTHRFDVGPPIIPAAVLPMPQRVVVLSDLEGDQRFLQAALRELDLVDGGGRWSGGATQLVVVGDSVDRGRDAFAVLWRLRDLQREAAAAGGAVHVLIGNHEQYLLRGIGKSLHAEHRHALARLGGPATAFAAGTLIGDWLRQLPVAVRLGDTLFVHGGLSASTASALPGVEVANAAIRGYWLRSGATARSRALDAVLGGDGLTQFRGAVPAEDGGPAPTSDVAVALEAWGARRMVVGHTLVSNVQAVQGARVFAVDVAEPDLPQAALTFVNGEPVIVPIRARRTDNKAGHGVLPARRVDHAGLIAGTVAETRRAAAIPMPY